MTKAIAKELIVDSKLFAAHCVSISKAGAKLDAAIQLGAMSAINHAEKHGDIGFVNRLFLSMNAGSRKSALTGWLLAHGKVMANGGDNKKEMPFLFDKERTTDMAGGAQNPWFTFKLDPAPDMTFDVIAALKMVIKKAQGKNVDALQLAKVENLMRDMEQGSDTSADAVQA